MSSYSYQPKVFRHTNGCCICKAKSSSSRFTNSQKYESEFPFCFNLKEQRTGKICNACVLIFKRWRKLPDKYTKNWEHVVDSKDKQGRKTLKTLKVKKTENTETSSRLKPCLAKKHRYIPKSSRHDYLSDDQGLGEEFSGSSASSISGEERLSEGCLSSIPNSLAPSPHPPPVYNLDDVISDSRHNLSLRGVAKRKQRRNLIIEDIENFKRRQAYNIKNQSDFIDPKFWSTYTTCCGLAYVSKCGEMVMIDDKSYNPCVSRKTPDASSSPNRASSSSRSSSTSIRGHELEDEGVESCDEEHQSVASYSSHSSATIPQSTSTNLGLNMLMQFSRALVV